MEVLAVELLAVVHGYLGGDPEPPDDVLPKEFMGCV